MKHDARAQLNVWFLSCEQQEEEKRKQKIEIWDSMQQGKSYKGAAKLSEVGFRMIQKPRWLPEGSTKDACWLIDFITWAITTGISTQTAAEDGVIWSEVVKLVRDLMNASPCRAQTRPVHQARCWNQRPTRSLFAVQVSPAPEPTHTQALNIPRKWFDYGLLAALVCSFVFFHVL